MNPESLRYAKSHEWVHLEETASGEKIATLGISQFAVEALTDLVFIDLPAVGRQVSAGQPLCEIESVKAVSDIYSPVNGEVIEANTDLPDHLEILSDDPYGKAWIVRIRLADDGGLDQ
ncbi:MAG: glycine cleavage system protein GcvH, partial [Pirellulales bacterium]